MRRHDVDAISLVFGLIFLGAAMLVAIVALGAPAGTAMKLAVPVVLLCAGTAGLLASTRPRR